LATISDSAGASSWKTADADELTHPMQTSNRRVGKAPAMTHAPQRTQRDERHHQVTRKSNLKAKVRPVELDPHTFEHRPGVDGRAEMLKVVLQRLLGQAVATAHSVDRPVVQRRPVTTARRLECRMTYERVDGRSDVLSPRLAVGQRTQMCAGHLQHQPHRLLSSRQVQRHTANRVNSAQTHHITPNN
jgi:hypothetical protein